MGTKLSIAERLAASGFQSVQLEILRKLIDQYDFDLRCCAPGIIQSFDSEAQTVEVQLVIKDIIYVNGQSGREIRSIQIPILPDVPIVLPRAGGFSITLPVKKGDECLVFFADRCIDSWWQNGASSQDATGTYIAQEPMAARRHDLSDGFAILGTWSQPNTIDNYNTDALEIRSDNGDTIVRIEDGVVTIISESIKLGDVSGLRKLIDERLITLFNNHTHLYNPGPGSSVQTAVPTVPLTDETCATTNTEAI